MFELNGKVAIVTGGASGIGLATALRLKRAGAEVWIADIQAPLAAVKGCHVHQADLSDPAQMTALCDAVMAAHGRLDIMVNNAAIAAGRLLAEADAVRAERLWRVNQLSVLTGIKEAGALRRCDTATGTVRPLDAGPVVRMYTCGITPYDATHMGHAATYITYDVLHRRLLDRGHEVRLVRNITISNKRGKEIHAVTIGDYFKYRGTVEFMESLARANAGGFLALSE